MAIDIKDTSGFFLDDELDDEGGGAYDEELVAGPNPGRKTFREVDSKLETLNLQKPQGLKAGTSIKLTTRGTEVSRVEYDARFEAALARINREFNTEGAERFNSKVDGVDYPEGSWQDKTVHDVIEQIVADSLGLLEYDGSAPRTFAGPISFRNVPAPQAISQALEVEGNALWTLVPGTKTVTVVERAPSEDPVGEVGVNVVEQDLTGATASTDKPAIVLDRNGTGKKTQYGGPAWFGRTEPKAEEVFGAPEPLELEADISDLARAAAQVGLSVNEAYGYSRHVFRGQKGWRSPKDGNGDVVKAELRLVQKGQMAGDLVTRNPGFVSKSYQANLLTHPTRSFAFEVFAAPEPAVFQERTVSVSKSIETENELRQIINAAGGRITTDLTDTPSQERASLVLVKSSPFPWRPAKRAEGVGFVAGPIENHVRMAIVAFFAPRWQAIDGLVDVERGEFVFNPSDQAFASLVNAFGFPANFAVSYGYTTDPNAGAKPDPLGFTTPVLAVSVLFVQGLALSRFRAHVVTVEEVDPQVSPDGGTAPFGQVERGDYEVHNVVFNAARERGHLEPAAAPRNDVERMKTRAMNLARSLTLSAMAKGSITVWPGKIDLRVGQPANGGVIVKIKHTYAPFFKTQFWLEGTPEVDNPEQRHFRKKVGEYEGLTQTNSSRISEGARRTDSAASSAAGNRVEPHDHKDDKSGGTSFGEVELAGASINGVDSTGLPKLTVRRGSQSGGLDAKWLAGLGRMVSGGLLLEVSSIQNDGTATGRVLDVQGTLPDVTGVAVFVGGSFATDAAAIRAIVRPGSVYPLQFVEFSNPLVGPQPAIYVDAVRLVVDHVREDEQTADPGNRSTLVFPAKEEIDDEGEPIQATEDDAGDLDDLTIVERRQLRTGGEPETGSFPPRWQLYVAEEDAGFNDSRGGFVTGPWKGGQERSDHRSGLLSDLMRYSRDDERNPNRLTHRIDGLWSQVDTEQEGPLDFADLHGDIPVTPLGVKGCAIVYDGLEWTGVAGEQRGLRYKVVPICDHVHADAPDLPTDVGNQCKQNQSTQVWEGDLSEAGQFSDFTTVHAGRWRLYMEPFDGCDGSVPLDPCRPTDRRRGLFVTNRVQRATFGEVFTYHDMTAPGETRLDLQAGVHFKAATVLGGPLWDGPLPFREQAAAVEPAPIHAASETLDYLYGRLVLDRQAARKCGAPGEWVVEIPFDYCQVDPFSEKLDEMVAAINANFAKLAAGLAACCGIGVSLEVVASGCGPVGISAGEIIPLEPPPPPPFPGP